jgi:hypothetical protein
MKIGVVTLHYGEIQPYFIDSEAINRLYCEKHGYDFEKGSPYTGGDRDPMWGKLTSVMKSLESHDWVLFMDADAWFYDHSKTIEDLLAGQVKNHSFLCTNDRRDKDFTWSDVFVNAGVYMVKNSREGRELMQAWWDIPNRWPYWAYGWPLDQGAFNRHIITEHYNQISYVWYDHMNGHDGKFIRHLMGTTVEEKNRIIGAERKRLVL